MDLVGVAPTRAIEDGTTTIRPMIASTKLVVAATPSGRESNARQCVSRIKVCNKVCLYCTMGRLNCLTHLYA